MIDYDYDDDDMAISEEILPAPKRPMPDGNMFYGIFKDFVELLAQHSEADPMSHLATLYSYVGCMAGREYAISGKPPSVWPVTVGDASLGRKGTGRDDVQACFDGIQGTERSLLPRISTSAATESGIIREVRDKTDKDNGEDEKRLWVDIQEFGKVLQAMKNPVFNLQDMLCTTWDGRDQRISTSKGVLQATRQAISLYGNITGPMFAERFEAGPLSGGILSRIMPIFVERARFYRGLVIPEDFKREREELGLLLAKRIDNMRSAVGKGTGDTIELNYDRDVQRWWKRDGHELMTTDPTDLSGLGRMFSARRGDNFRRVAAIVALAHETDTVTMDHVQAGISFVDYSMATVRYMEPEYGFTSVSDAKTSTISPKARKFLAYVQKQMDEGASVVSQTEIYTKAFGRNTRAEDIHQIAGTITNISYYMDTVTGSSRPTKFYYIIDHPGAHVPS